MTEKSGETSVRITPYAGRYETFRALHHGARPLLLPNAWDRATALALAAAGFAAVGTTSLGVAAAAGRPDAEGSTRAETLGLAGVATRLTCPLTVDIEGGFGGGPEEIAALCAELAALGAAGVNLEDGRPDGTLADPRFQADAVAAIKERVPDLFVNARTDPYWLGLDAPLRTALDRAATYAEAGADGVFVPGIATAADISTAVENLRTPGMPKPPRKGEPLTYNYPGSGSAGGRANSQPVDNARLPLNVLFLPAHHTLAALADLGVARISLGSLLYRAALHAAVTTAQAIAENTPIRTDLPSYGEIQKLIGPPAR